MQQVIREKADLTAEPTLEELRRVAFFNIRELFDERGRLKNLKTLPLEVTAATASTEVIRTNMVAGDHRREWLHKVKLWDKPAKVIYLRERRETTLTPAARK